MMLPGDGGEQSGEARAGTLRGSSRRCPCAWKRAGRPSSLIAGKEAIRRLGRALPVFIALCLAGCSSSPPRVNPTGGGEPVSGSLGERLAAARGALAEEALDLEERLQRALSLLEEARSLTPGTTAERREFLTLLARVRFDLADALEDRASPDAVFDLLERARNDAYEALLLVPGFKAAMDASRPIDEETLEAVPSGYAEPLLLMAEAWGRMLSQSGFLAKMADGPRVLNLGRRALTLDPNVRHGGPHRFFGAWWSEVPSIAGRDLEKSRRHFAAALRIAPDYLFNSVLLARYALIPAGESQEARRILESVLATPLAGDDPEWIEQELARRRARVLLENLREK